MYLILERCDRGIIVCCLHGHASSQSSDGLKKKTPDFSNNLKIESSQRQQHSK